MYAKDELRCAVCVAKASPKKTAILLFVEVFRSVNIKVSLLWVRVNPSPPWKKSGVAFRWETGMVDYIYAIFCLAALLSYTCLTIKYV